MNTMKKALLSARTTYVTWFLSSRLLVFGFVFMFMFVYFIKPMNELSKILGTPINILEPFAAIANNRYALPLLILGYLVLIADFPCLNDFATFSLFRTGRMTWLLGQIIFLVMSGFTYIIFILTSSMISVSNNAYILNVWSLVQKKLSIGNETSISLQSLYPFAKLDNSVLVQARPYEAVFHGIVLILLFEITVGCVQMIFALNMKKIISVFINLSACATGLVLMVIDIKIKWLFPISNTVFGWHYDELYNKTNMPIYASYIYFIVILTILTAILASITKRCSFHITGGTE